MEGLLAENVQMRVSTAYYKGNTHFSNENVTNFLQNLSPLLCLSPTHEKSLIATTNNGETFFTSSTVTGSDLNVSSLEY